MASTTAQPTSAPAVTAKPVTPAPITSPSARRVELPPALVIDVDDLLREHGIEANPAAIEQCLAWLLDATPQEHQRNLR